MLPIVFVDPQEGSLSLLLGGDGSPYFPCGFHRHWGRLEDHSVLVRMQIQPPHPIFSATTPKKALGASLWSGKGGSWSSIFSGGQEKRAWFSVVFGKSSEFAVKKHSIL